MPDGTLNAPTPAGTVAADPVTVSRQLLRDIHKALPNFRTGRFLILKQQIADALEGR